MKNSDSLENRRLRARIERYLVRTRTPAARFGRQAVNDPRLVFDLREGRRVGKRVGSRLRAWLDRTEGGR